MAPQSARRDRKTSAIHSASEHAWVMRIRFANSHTGQRHYARANRPDRWQHPTTANTRIYSCIFRGVHRWEADPCLSERQKFMAARDVRAPPLHPLVLGAPILFGRNQRPWLVAASPIRLEPGLLRRMRCCHRDQSRSAPSKGELAAQTAHLLVAKDLRTGH